jgi:hypothetical protein
VTFAQLALFATTNGDGHRRTVAQAGLRREIGPDAGAERLLRELVRRGLADDALVPAAALILALEHQALPPEGNKLERAA